MRDCLRIGRSCGGGAPSLEEAFSRLAIPPCRYEVMCNQLRFDRQLQAEFVRQPAVYVLAHRLQHAVIGSIANERVLERISCVRPPSAAEDELGIHKLIECLFQLDSA